MDQFDWKFNAQAIDRAQIEQLPTGKFVRRGENLAMMGQSGVGKSFLLQAISRRFCELGYRVRYTTSADLLEDLRKSPADESLPRRIRYRAKFDLLIIDEFGFDRIERGECPQAASLFYQVIDRMRIFLAEKDYDAFHHVVEQTLRVSPIRIGAYGWMPNRGHFVLWPEGDGDLPRFMQRMTNMHTQRRQRAKRRVGYGHLYQGRFKSFPIESGEH